MEFQEYREIIDGIGARRSLGQSFLVNESIARMEAAYGKGMNVLELGPGLGILTRELCASARSVVAVEKDPRLTDMLKMSIKSRRLRLVGRDFFEVDAGSFGKPDIMISNIPYSLSSKVIQWLLEHRMPALICVQREFADHMTAIPGTRDYSKLSVVSSLAFKVHKVKEVAAGNFYPKPKVDSEIVYLAPRSTELSGSEMSTISLLMNHKKKRLRNAIMDSCKSLRLDRRAARKLSEEVGESTVRPFQMGPSELLEVSRRINALLE